MFVESKSPDALTATQPDEFIYSRCTRRQGGEREAEQRAESGELELSSREHDQHAKNCIISLRRYTRHSTTFVAVAMTIQTSSTYCTWTLRPTFIVPGNKYDFSTLWQAFSPGDVFHRPQEKKPVKVLKNPVLFSGTMIVGLNSKHWGAE